MSLWTKVRDFTTGTLGVISDMGLGTNFTGIQASKDANKANIANQWNLLQSDRAYNTPSAVMQRYIDAGLNPALMYGQAGTGNVSSHMASIQSTGGVGGNAGTRLENIIDAYNAIKVSDKVIESADLNNKKTEAEIDLINSQTAENEFNNSLGMRILNILGQIGGLVFTGSRIGKTIQFTKNLTMPKK